MEGGSHRGHCFEGEVSVVLENLEAPLSGVVRLQTRGALCMVRNTTGEACHAQVTKSLRKPPEQPMRRSSIVAFIS